MNFLLKAFVIWIAMMVLTILWLVAQVMHYIIPIVLVLLVFAFWDKLRGTPEKAREYPDPERN